MDSNIRTINVCDDAGAYFLNKAFEAIELILHNNITKLKIINLNNLLFVVHDLTNNALLLFTDRVSELLLHQFEHFLNLCLSRTIGMGGLPKGYVKAFSKVILMDSHTTLIVF